MAGLDVQGEGGGAALDAVVEGSVVHAGVDDIAVRLGGGLLRVGRRLPVELHAAAALEAGREGPRREWLDHVRGVVEFAQRFEDALVDGPAGRETEGRVEAVFHVGEVLVAQQFQDHRGDARGAGLAVAAVPEAAARPQRVEVLPQVLHDLALDVVAEHAADRAVAPVGERPFAFVAERVDGERAHGAVAGRHARVGVEGEREVDGNVLLLAHHHGPGAAGGVVAGVIGLPGARDGGVRARPLHPVVGAFGGSRHPGGAAGALQLAHAAADLDGVGGHDVAGAAAVVQDHLAVGAFGEFEGAEIDPGAAAPLLVDGEFRLAAEVVDRVMGLAGAVGEGFIGDIDGVLAALLDVGRPGGRRRGGGAGALRLPHRAGEEGKVFEGVGGLGVGESHAGVAPAALLVVAARAAHQPLARPAERRVVVRDDFTHLRVALARRHHVGAGVLEHRDQEGEDVGLRVHVLHRAVDAGALPGPEAVGVVEIASVALPEDDVAVVEALEPAARADALDEARLRLARVLRAEGVAGRLAVGAQHGRRELLQLVAVGDDPPGLVVFPSPLLLELLAEPGHVGLVPGEVGKVVVEGDVELVAADLDLGRRDAVVHGGAAVEPRGEGVADGAQVADARGLCCGGQDGQEDRQERRKEWAGLAGHLCFRILERSTMKVNSEAMPMARQSAPKSLGSWLR